MAKRDLISDVRFRTAAHYFELACSYSRKHRDLAQSALAEYGDHGPDTSGCVRTHFPEHIKAALRGHARMVAQMSDNAWSARPKGVRAATMRQLASDIATRDGSGFYGPQPHILNNHPAA